MPTHSSTGSYVPQVGDDGKLRILKSFFVKYDRKLEELCEDFMAYYNYHRTHTVIFYYDSTFLGQEYASSKGQSFAAIIKSMFRRHQWHVREVYRQTMGTCPEE